MMYNESLDDQRNKKKKVCCREEAVDSTDHLSCSGAIEASSTTKGSYSFAKKEQTLAV